ncbi:unnamed protein product [Parnassius mnemosyne]|uniref:DUF5641 domain-containing protein n=1 Tax=Parnassius mnemosyne TaxID=213953 RepID=A0AAV1KH40_9NEOP
MENLPSPRVQPTRCFQNVGIDFAGPFIVKESHRRNARTYKAYVCVFVCLAVKAIHLEAVTELSTSAFLAALDRFVSRRGLCTFIVTDCGTNFIDARRYLNELQQMVCKNKDSLESSLAKRNIWRLNPPTGSNFGGIFESGVKSMKFHLKRVIGLQVLTFEELITILTKVDSNLPPLEWRSGRVQDVHPGKDGVVRVVTLRTTNGLHKRPVNKLCLLYL